MKHQNPLQHIAAFAILIGVTFTSCIDYGRQEPTTSKLADLLHVIGNQYVDTVDMAELVEKTIPKVLAELDPHSVYIPAKDAEESNQELRGSFSGIGIQFMIQSDTIYISDVVSGGPSEKVGLMAGDRIVTIDDSLYVGKKISNDGAMMFLADGAYGVTEITGGGLETIIKQKGSAGTADPLDQRSSIGWKAIKTAEILVEPYMVRVECKSALSGEAEAN